MGARDEILEKAAYLFSTQGYRATSLAQVARAANVSKALVLWHFESKEQLFRSALQHFLAPYEIDDQRLAGLSEYAQIERLIDDYYEFLAEHLSSVKFLFAQVLREDESASEILSHVRRLYHIYHGLLTSILEAGKEKGVFAEGVCPADEAALITASLNGLFVQQLVDGQAAESVRNLLLHFKRTLQMRLCPSFAQSESILSQVCVAGERQ